MISLGKEKDVPDILKMAKAFFEESRYKDVISFSEEKSRQAILSLVEGVISDGVVFLARDENNACTGFLGALKGYLPFSEDAVGLELGMYVLPAYRKSNIFLHLFDVYEYWCQEVAKVAYIQVSTLEDNPTLDKFYLKKGYVKSESAYLKKLPQVT